MKITPQGPEFDYVTLALDEFDQAAATAAVLAVLKKAEAENSPYGSLAEVAAAIVAAVPVAVTKETIKAAARALEHRGSFAVALGYETVEGSRRGQYFGPYGSEIDAKKAADGLAGAGHERRVITLNSTATLAGMTEGTLWPGFCTCSHAPGDHRMAGNAKGPCAIEGCRCKKYADASLKKKPAAKRATKGNAS